MRGIIERIENLEDYLDRIKRKSIGKDTTVFFTTEVIQIKAEDKIVYKSYFTLSTLLEQLICMNTSILCEAIVANQDDIKLFGEKTRTEENTLIDKTKKELPACKLIRGSVIYEVIREAK